MATAYKLTYFNARGRAEVCRLMFAYKKADYVDERIEREDWPKIKPTTPFGQLPILTVDGEHMIGQSGAIVRFLATRLNLRGNNELETAKADMIYDCCSDIASGLTKIKFASDQSFKAQLIADMKQILPDKIAFMDKLCVGPYFLGDEICYADFQWSILCSFLLLVDPNCLDNSSKLKAVTERVESDPNVKNWMEIRPKTDF